MKMTIIQKNDMSTIKNDK